MYINNRHCNQNYCVSILSLNIIIAWRHGSTYVTFAKDTAATSAHGLIISLMPFSLRYISWRNSRFLPIAAISLLIYSVLGSNNFPKLCSHVALAFANDTLSWLKWYSLPWIGIHSPRERRRNFYLVVLISVNCEKCLFYKKGKE